MTNLQAKEPIFSILIRFLQCKTIILILVFNLINTRQKSIIGFKFEIMFNLKFYYYEQFSKCS